jgi:hypothetical protein
MTQTLYAHMNNKTIKIKTNQKHKKIDILISKISKKKKE